MPPPNWSSLNLDIPVADFLRMFGLTRRELEWADKGGMLDVRGIPAGPNRYVDVVVTESSIRLWIRSKMPRSVARRIAKAGGLAALDAWRDDYISRIQFDPKNNAMTLPNGERMTNVFFKKATTH